MLNPDSIRPTSDRPTSASIFTLFPSKPTGGLSAMQSLSIGFNVVPSTNPDQVAMDLEERGFVDCDLCPSFQSVAAVGFIYYQQGGSAGLAYRDHSDRTS